MELIFFMGNVSLVVFEAPNQIEEMHLKAYASGLLHEELRNIKVSVRLRLAYLSARASVVLAVAQLRQWLPGTQLHSRDLAALGQFWLSLQSCP